MVKELPPSTGLFNSYFLLIILGAMVWLIGGNLVIARHFKRRGMPATEGLRLGGLLKVSLSFRELVELLGIAAFGIGLIVLGAARL